MRLLRTTAAITAPLAMCLGVLFSGQSTAFADSSTDNNVTATDVATAVQDTGLTAQSNDVHTTSDANSAAVSTTDGTTVDVPKDAADGVGITSNDGATLTVTPPVADASGTGKVVADGVVAYPSKDGSATAVQATDNGGVRMLTVIDNADAPTRYPYNVSVPDGGSIKLNDDGSAVVFDGSGQPIASVAPPWATDANGNAVPTHFEVNADGTTLTQVIDHNANGVAYPVTADPFWSTLWSFVGCITGVGAPIGMAFVIAALPATWPAIFGWAANQSANGDRAIITYVTKVHNACRRFMRS